MSKWTERLFDADGKPKAEATLLEQLAVEALNEVKAWRDSDGNEGFPESTRLKIDAVLMTYEQRRFVRSETPRSLSDKRIEEIAGEAYLAWVNSSDKNPRWALERAIRAALLEAK